jgi:hypothetical protein
LSNMRNGTVTEQDSALLLSRCLNKLPSNKRIGFDNFPLACSNLEIS